MSDDDVPAPLGWCVDCLVEDKRVRAETIANGHAVCATCSRRHRRSYEDELHQLGQRPL